MLIHISKERWVSIQSYGQQLKVEVSESEPLVMIKRFRKGDNVYHLLNSEQEFCPDCGLIAESIKVNTPTELEYWKLSPSNEAATLT